jgi:hypothetical protein
MTALNIRQDDRPGETGANRPKRAGPNPESRFGPMAIEEGDILILPIPKCQTSLLQLVLEQTIAFRTVTIFQLYPWGDILPPPPDLVN